MVADAARIRRGPHDASMNGASMTETARLAPGDTAPEFTLDDQDGRPVSLSDFRGSKLVVFTYPQALTPGCTTEACDFRDNEEHLLAAGYKVVGISSDAPEKQTQFREQHDLRFPLLSDADHAVQTAYGAYGERNKYGKIAVGPIRSTFLIDEEGRIIDALYNVRASGHVERVLRRLGETA